MTADGFGASQINDAMVITDAGLVPDNPIPEPSTVLLLAGGLLATALGRRHLRF